jgi:hypothetical protein
MINPCFVPLSVDLVGRDKEAVFLFNLVLTTN